MLSSLIDIKFDMLLSSSNGEGLFATGSMIVGSDTMKESQGLWTSVTEYEEPREREIKECMIE